ncbi:YihY/virulence factor BrkB family protein [Sphingomonas sp. IC-56]|uniref:YihY/virulence factor BrkB family protein n=1 Tax=Sphingomonas sp. IC-56 TaxID=2898529 RepID=UPI001E48A6AA|nr:YihY/virulence factor BrkB family protein [Sphingomonas sp. IC-56]MCD2323221.1 YihY/virulence factor BrkB family protein [Sphingomonas sp. IC-56]
MDAKGRDATSPWKMPLAGWKQVAVRTWNESSDDNVGLIAAGVAFYGFLALAPTLAAIVLCYGIFADTQTVMEHMQALTSMVPPDVAGTIGEQLMQLVQTSDGKKGMGALIALAVAIFGARNGAGAVITALNIAYEEQEKRSFIMVNLTALALTAAAVLAAILAGLALAALAALGRLMHYDATVLPIAGTVVTYVLLTLAGAAGAAALYRFGPSRSKAKWAWLSAGSIFSAVLWLALTLGFSAYVRYVAKFDATYGSLGAVVALLTFLYLASYVLLFGAELNSELEHQTAEDTTTGAEQPMGERRAWVADHVAADGDKGGEADDAPAKPKAAEPTGAAPHVAARPIARRPSTPAAPAAEPGTGFVAGRVAARGARVSGLPKIGWVTTGLVTVGLSMVRRRGKAGAGVALIAAATGLSWMRARD